MPNLRKISALESLESKFAQALHAIGIHTADDLKKAGALATFMRLQGHDGHKPSLNFLYAMVAALEEQSWVKDEVSEKVHFLLALDNAEQGK